MQQVGDIARQRVEHGEHVGRIGAGEGGQLAEIVTLRAQHVAERRGAVGDAADEQPSGAPRKVDG